MLGYSDTRVRDLECGPAVPLSHAHHDLTSLRSVLYGVVQKDHRGLADTGLVKGELDRLLGRRVLDRDLAVSRSSCCLRGVGGDGAQIPKGHLQGHFRITASQG